VKAIMHFRVPLRSEKFSSGYTAGDLSCGDQLLALSADSALKFQQGCRAVGLLGTEFVTVGPFLPLAHRFLELGGRGVRR
jgi:hypothetical protein